MDGPLYDCAMTHKIFQGKQFLRSVNFEMTCWYPEFFQKMNEKIQPTVQYYDTSDRLVFVRFWEELKTPKSPSEMN